ncbi:transmembrane protein 247-like [Anolis carolinensis]|uniref:transmembrane protein 247-like n=1 Tax=Anolis carolinensis TaxID=28377 RepID=UPI000203A5C5
MDSWATKQRPSKKKGHNTLELQLKKMRLKIKLIMIRYYYKDREKKRQHKENMEEMRLLAKATQPSGRGDHLLMLQDHLTLFLYCFIFIHIIYIVKALVFFFIKKHVGH